MEETRVCPCKAMGESRREFCAAIAALGLGAAAVVPGAVAAFSGGFDPIMRGSAAGETPEFNLGALSSLPEDGTPVKKAIIADKQDGWTKYSNVPVGAVWLRREGDKVSAFNVLCPHNGCFIAFDPEGKQFKCPCHNAFFQLDGKQNGSSISPRDMDSLEVEVRDGNVFVKFQNFKFGCEEKVAQA